MDGFTAVPARDWVEMLAQGPPAAEDGDASNQAIVSALAAITVERGARVVGIGGAVAAGKSTLARQLVAALADRQRVELVGTDGFLFPNRVLEAASLSHRKGFPESFDGSALDTFFTAVRSGVAINVPLYSHVVYDVVDSRPLKAHDVLVVEGVNALQRYGGALESLDLAVFLDADEPVLVEWYVTRFRALCREARTDPSSFYFPFSEYDESEVELFARHVWSAVNGVNLAAHILPSRANADLVLQKDRFHRIHTVLVRSSEDGVTHRR